MNLNNINLPYPVLGMSDDILPLPETPILEVNPNETFEHKFVITLETNNKYIDELIKKGCAVYACEIECRKTFYRTCFTSNQSSFEVRFPRKAVSGEIIITPTVVAKSQIYNYINPGFHEDYKGYFFNIEPGDLLCVFQQQLFSAEIEYDKLKAVSTFITILKTDKAVSYIDLDKPKIHLYLPEELYRQYRTRISHQSEFNSPIHASLALNALLYGILQYEQYSDKKWALTIKYRINSEPQFENLDLSIPSDAIKIAQLLLGDPYKRMFNNFMEIE